MAHRQRAAVSASRLFLPFCCPRFGELRGDQAIARGGMAELRITSAGWAELWTCETFTSSLIS